MPNMSYCRFRNTLSDLQDCADHLGDDLSSEEEEDAREQLVRCCLRIVQDYGVEDDDE